MLFQGVPRGIRLSANCSVMWSDQSVSTVIWSLRSSNGQKGRFSMRAILFFSLSFQNIGKGCLSISFSSLFQSNSVHLKMILICPLNHDIQSIGWFKNPAYGRHWIFQHIWILAPKKCHMSHVTCPKCQQTETLSLLTPPPCTVGWFATTKKTKQKNNKKLSLKH